MWAALYGCDVHWTDFCLWSAVCLIPFSISSITALQKLKMLKWKVLRWMTSARTVSRLCQFQLLKGKSSNEKWRISISTDCSMDTHSLNLQENQTLNGNAQLKRVKYEPQLTKCTIEQPVSACPQGWRTERCWSIMANWVKYKDQAATIT